MPRLTKELKKTIFNKALETSGVSKKYKDIIASRVQLAEEIRISENGEDEPKHKIMKKIHELEAEIGYNFLTNSQLRQNYKLSLKIGNNYIDYYFNGVSNRVEREITSLKWVYKLHHGENVKIKHDSEFATRYQVIEDNYQDYLKDYENLKINIHAALNSVNTSDQLIKLWPEAKELLPIEEKIVPMPALPVKDLNALIGLPS